MDVKITGDVMTVLGVSKVESSNKQAFSCTVISLRSGGNPMIGIQDSRLVQVATFRNVHQSIVDFVRICDLAKQYE